MLMLFVSPAEMLRSLLVVLALFTELISRNDFFVVSLRSETCSAKNQDCNMAEVEEHPKLFMLEGVRVRWRYEY